MYSIILALYLNMLIPITSKNIWLTYLLSLLIILIIIIKLLCLALYN